MLTKYRDLMTMKAFRPNKQDCTYSLIERFAGESLLGLFFCKKSVGVLEIEISKSKDIQFSEITTFDSDENESMAAVIAQISAKWKYPYAAISLLDSPEIFPISTQYRLKEGMTVQEALIRDGSNILGPVYQADRTYLAIGSQENSFEYILSYDKAWVDGLFNQLKNSGFTPIRISCPFYSILFEASLCKEEQAILVYLKNHLMLAFRELRGWGSISLSHDLREDQLESVIDEFLAQLPKKSEKIKVVSDSDWDLGTYIKDNYNHWDVDGTGGYINHKVAPFQAMIRNG